MTFTRHSSRRSWAITGLRNLDIEDIAAACRIAAAIAPRTRKTECLTELEAEAYSQRLAWKRLAAMFAAAAKKRGTRNRVAPL